ncbi:hypothetical protein [Aliamphritea spongicola]|nr:hypothetical protein [Aliamphritea spongicola]
MFGFLSAEHIRNLHQLALKIRNFDNLVDEFLENSEKEDIDLYREIESRMPYIEDCAQLILMYISDQYPEYEELLAQTKALEKPQYVL